MSTAGLFLMQIHQFLLCIEWKWRFFLQKKFSRCQNWKCIVFCRFFPFSYSFLHNFPYKVQEVYIIGPGIDLYDLNVTPKLMATAITIVRVNCIFKRLETMTSVYACQLNRRNEWFGEKSRQVSTVSVLLPVEHWTGVKYDYSFLYSNPIQCAKRRITMKKKDASAQQQGIIMHSVFFLLFSFLLHLSLQLFNISECSVYLPYIVCMWLISYNKHSVASEFYARHFFYINGEQKKNKNVRIDFHAGCYLSA